jgi:hypothetical protein
VTLTEPALRAAVEPARPPALKQPPISSCFLWALLAATATPLVAMSIIAHITHPSLGVEKARQLIVFLGSGVHVATSYGFYADSEMRPLLRAHRTRFVIAPLFLVVGAALGYTLANQQATAAFLLLYLIWQTHHYTRQNIGVLAFTAKASRSGSPSTLERTAVTVAGYAGVLGMITFGTPYLSTGLRSWTWQLDTMARLVFGAAILLTCAAMPSVLRTRSLWRFMYLWACVLFYLPTFLFRNPVAAISSYALAHGFQYIVFMGYVARGGRTRRAQRAVTSAFVGLAVFGGLLLSVMQDGRHWGPVANPIFGTYLGLVMVHFVIDAGIWRLHDPANRAYMKRRFTFLQ